MYYAGTILCLEIIYESYLGLVCKSFQLSKMLELILMTSTAIEN